ncbi:MAG: nucleotidyltransferase family protein [Clostridia bacterium]|nr:nucleotidyltransferase family protein [Clostridia bacterium]
MNDKKLGCLVMAAGNAKRFRANKLAAEFDGKMLIERALDAVPEALFSQVTVVTQYPQIEELAKQSGFASIRNEHPDWGISHTIRLGTTAMQDCDAILYLVSDQPKLTRDSVRRVAEQWLAHPACIIGAAHDGKRGNPCMFPKAFFGELMQLREDNGGNTVIKMHPESLLTVEVEKAELTDVDTPEALNELKKDGH